MLPSPPTAPSTLLGTDLREYGVDSTLLAVNINGRALDRVTKEKHRPNRQKCPKIVQKLCFRPLRTIFGHFSDIFSTFFGHFVGTPIFWAVLRLARYNVNRTSLAQNNLIEYIKRIPLGTKQLPT